MSTPRERAWSRGTYRLALGLYAVFVVYGSLVPLRFRPLAIDHALARFLQVVRSPVFVYSRTDVAVNVLLFVPLAYLMMAALRTDRRGAAGAAAAAAVTLATSVVLPAAIEFAQIFFPGRTLALSDMLAESTGGAIGVTLWLLAGARVTDWLRAFLQERERPAFVQRILVAYLVLYSLSQIMPLDLTVSLGLLARKYRRGRILLQPFTYSHESAWAALWDYGGDIVLAIPVGMAAALAWTQPGTRRSWVRALPAALAAVAGVELAQVFVMSRYADATDIITGGVGVVIGIVLAGVLSTRRVRVEPHSPRLVRIARAGLVLPLAYLASYHWSPYDFSFAPEQVAEGVRRLMTIPFLGYYSGPEFGAFTEMARKSLLAVPLGVVLSMAWPLAPGERTLTSTRRLVLLGCAFVALCGIEVGQVFLPTRYPDTTDAFIGEIGVAAGLWLTTRILGTTHMAEHDGAPAGPALAREAADRPRA